MPVSRYFTLATPALFTVVSEGALITRPSGKSVRWTVNGFGVVQSVREKYFCLRKSETMI
jgi:hypothetical protein